MNRCIINFGFLVDSTDGDRSIRRADYLENVQRKEKRGGESNK